jgi:hypothetical protein
MKPFSPILAFLIASLAAAQDEAAPPETSLPPLAYPADKDTVVAKVAGRELRLEDLVQHIAARHVPDFLRTLEGGGQNLFRSSTIVADWVRQYADIVALQAEARQRGIDAADVEPMLAATLKRLFEEHLASYQGQRAAEGHPLELTQDRINLLLDLFQRRNGLRTELQGWLDFLTQDEPGDDELTKFYRAHAGMFGGRVTFAAILIENRDRVTARQFNAVGNAQVLEKVADIKARLAADGSNFETVAQRFSEDRKTAADGGRLHNVARFEPTLPAILCRTAWQLADGEVAGPIESPYGLHFIKRISFATVDPYFLPTPDKMPVIRQARLQLRQEDLIFELRRRLQVEILY